jgi:hypothetical protein
MALLACPLKERIRMFPRARRANKLSFCGNSNLRHRDAAPQWRSTSFGEHALQWTYRERIARV